jgi:CubicO group peptidase (beta-lactamase class C family)
MRVLLGLGAVAMVAPGCGSAPAARAEWSARLDAELAAICADPAQPLASLSVLAIRAGEVVYEGQCGRRHIDPDLPADRDTLYRIASISKLVTTLGVMRLVDEGRLDLDADVSTYLGWRLRNPHFPDAPITLRMLLTHTSSLRDDGGYSWPAGTAIRDVLGDKTWSARARPGAWFSYANLPWGVVGTVMEKATGERFDRLMQRLVLEPLGMRGGFEPAELPAAELGNLATLYRKRSGPEGKETWDPGGPWIAQVDDYSSARPVHRAASGYVVGSNGTLFGPQGNLRASAADLGRAMRMLMAGGVIDGKRFLRGETVGLMLSKQWRHDGTNGNSTYGSGKSRFNAWGLGVQHFLDVSDRGAGDRLVEGGGFVAAGHHGDAWGLNGAFAFDAATRNGLIYLAGGTGFDPALHPGTYSGFHRYEERILTALHRHALARR